jgi:DNA-binding XRE family transcriptional regulator
MMTVMPNVTVAIAAKVRGVAAENRFTQQHIAKVLNISRTSVGERYSGRVPFTGPELWELSVALRVDIRRLYPEAA